MKDIPFSILIVEDDEDDREIIDEAFIDLHYGQKLRNLSMGLHCYITWKWLNLLCTPA